VNTAAAAVFFALLLVGQGLFYFVSAYTRVVKAMPACYFEPIDVSRLQLADGGMGSLITSYGFDSRSVSFLKLNFEFGRDL
jgi:hypothetical protein